MRCAMLLLSVFVCAMCKTRKNNERPLAWRGQDIRGHLSLPLQNRDVHSDTECDVTKEFIYYTRSHNTVKYAIQRDPNPGCIGWIIYACTSPVAVWSMQL